MKKFKVFTDLEQEEKYLEEMALKGCFLIKRTTLGGYYFKKDEPKNLHYHVDLQKFRSSEDFINYKTLFEDSGWEHICGTKSSIYQYFIPKIRDSSESIFSTKQSEVLRYKSMYKMCFSFVLSALLYLLTLLIVYDFNFNRIAFLTPGLWEMEGILFWSAFFFELPFVLLRTVPVLITLFMGLLYAVWGVIAQKQYKKLFAKEV